MAALRCLLERLSSIAANRHSLNCLFKIWKTISNEGEELEQKIATWEMASNREPQIANRLSSKLKTAAASAWNYLSIIHRKVFVAPEDELSPV